VCESLHWDLGIAWTIDPSARVLRFQQAWHSPHGPAGELEKLSAASAFSPGVGLPGRALSTGEPSWITDLQSDLSFPRAPAAAVDGLRSGFGVPILRGSEPLAVVEFFSSEVRERDAELLRMMGTIGAEIGRVFGNGAAPEGASS
jgi:GAF domain-containing protein